MKTVIKLSRTNPTSGKPFYYVNVYSIDSIGATISQYSAWIFEEQYYSLKGIREEKYIGEVNLYQVDLV